MRKLSTGTGAQYLRPYLKHDDVEVKPSLLGLYSVMGTLEPWMEVNFKLCQGSKCNQSVDFLKWHQISEGDRLISTITFWRSKTNPFSRRTNSRISRFFIFINDFKTKISTKSKGDKSDFQTHQRDDTIRISVWAQTIDLHLDRQCGRCGSSKFYIRYNLNLNSWKDWIMKLLVLWFIRGFFQDNLDGNDTRLSSIQW